MSMRDPDDDRCDICHRRYWTGRAIMDCEAEHNRRDIAMREAGRTLKDSRAMGENLAATVEIEAARERGEMLVRVLL